MDFTTNSSPNASRNSIESVGFNGNGHPSGIPYSHRKEDAHTIDAKQSPRASLFYHSTPADRKISSRIGQQKFSPESLASVVSDNGCKSYTSPKQDTGIPRGAREKADSTLAEPWQEQRAGNEKVSWSPNRFSELEGSTIHRQRRELQLLVSELKDRDRELNEMVSSHHKQLIVYEADRQKVALYEKQNVKLKAHAKRSDSEIKDLKEKLHQCQQSCNKQQNELKKANDQLSKSLEKISTSSSSMKEIQERNSTLSNSIQELSSKLGQTEGQRQELLSSLKIKENDICDANHRLQDLTEQVKSLQKYKQAYKEMKSKLLGERDHWKSQYDSLKEETKKLEGEMSRSISNSTDQTTELASLQKESLMLQKELFLAGEREKRKDQLLELNRSKQDRLQRELHHVRQLNDRLQRDVMYLQQQTTGNQWMDVSDRLSDTTWNVTQSSQKEMLQSNQLHDNEEKKAHIEGDEVERTRQDEDCLYTDVSPLPDPDERLSRDYLNGTQLDSTGFLSIESSSSPTTRLHRLLKESKKMVESLEEQSSGTSHTSSPQKMDSQLLHLSDESSWTTTNPAPTRT